MAVHADKGMNRVQVYGDDERSSTRIAHKAVDVRL